MCWNPSYIFLILLSTVITYFGGGLIESFLEKEKLKYAKTILGLCIGSNLFVLFFYKYLNFGIDVITKLFRLLGMELSIPGHDLLLPVGISFYTFQALSYIIDVYQKKINAERNFFYYALFVSFFPQLVAGPIERSKHLLSELHNVKNFNFEKLKEGFLLMLWGYFLKLVIADRASIFVDKVYSNYEEFGGWFLIIATLLFAVQIYCDFCGYSIIAKGAALILGVDIMENFNSPYLSVSVSDFWRNWHISLTTWFRDYLYIPLGGNRKGKVHKYINKMIVFLLSGLWHGANTTFIIWGGINGLYQVIEDETYSLRQKISNILKIERDSIGHRMFQVIATNILISISWVFFRSQNVSQAFAILKSMMQADNFHILLDGSAYNCGLNSKNFWLLIISIIVLLVADMYKKRGVLIRKTIMSQNYIYRAIFYTISIAFILLFGVWGPAYDATGFIYFRF